VRSTKTDLSLSVTVLSLLVLPKCCIHVALERIFSDPAWGSASPEGQPCRTKCWICNPELSLGRCLKVVRNEIQRSLRLLFNTTGSSTTQGVVKALYADRLSIWGDAKLTDKDANRLTLQLVASGILQYSVKKSDMGDSHGSVLLNWGNGAGSHDLAYTEDIRWASISTD